MRSKQPKGCEGFAVRQGGLGGVDTKTPFPPLCTAHLSNRTTAFGRTMWAGQGPCGTMMGLGEREAEQKGRETRRDGW